MEKANFNICRELFRAMIFLLLMTSSFTKAMEAPPAAINTLFRAQENRVLNLQELSARRIIYDNAIVERADKILCPDLKALIKKHILNTNPFLFVQLFGELIQFPTNPSQPMTFRSANGRYELYLSVDGWVVLKNLETENSRHLRQVTSVSFSTDYRYLVTCSPEQSITLWNLHQNQVSIEKRPTKLAELLDSLCNLPAVQNAPLIDLLLILTIDTNLETLSANPVLVKAMQLLPSQLRESVIRLFNLTESISFHPEQEHHLKKKIINQNILFFVAIFGSVSLIEEILKDLTVPQLQLLLALKRDKYVLNTQPELYKALMHFPKNLQMPVVKHFKLEMQDGKDTPLTLACKQGKAELVKQFLETGAPVNQKDAAGDTPLIIASREGHTQIAMLLLDAKADISLRNNQGNNALKVAGNKNIALLLSAKTGLAKGLTHGGFF